MITQQEQEAIEAMVQSVNDELNNIINAREDVIALLRIHESINNDATENGILNDAKARALTASQALVTLLQ